MGSPSGSRARRQRWLDARGSAGARPRTGIRRVRRCERCGGPADRPRLHYASRTIRPVKVLVTGATGKVGNAVARALLERGDDVVVLARDPDAARAVLPGGDPAAARGGAQDGVPAAVSGSPTLLRGDVTDPASVATAVA